MLHTIHSLKLAFHMYVFQVRHPSSDFRKIRVHAEVHAKVIMPFPYVRHPSYDSDSIATRCVFYGPL